MAHQRYAKAGSSQAAPRQHRPSHCSSLEGGATQESITVSLAVTVPTRHVPRLSLLLIPDLALP